MAAANESQGLKIAVAVFVTLTVLLAVSTYFSYTAYSQADAKYTKAESDLATAKRAAGDALNQFDDLKKAVGARAEDPEAIKAEIKKEYTKVSEDLKAATDQVKEMVAKAQAAGAQGPELDDAKAKAEQITAAYLAEPNKTYISALARMTELVRNLSLLLTQVSLNYVDVKRNLESANAVNEAKIKVETEALTKAKADLAAEHDKHESERQTILSRIEQYQADNARLQTEVANLTTKGSKSQEDYNKNLGLAQQMLKEYRDRVERKDTVLERPDGVVTYVDYTRGEIHANLTRSTGARPQMQFTIFDSSSPGLPTDKPKGTVELVSVNDRESVARILKTENRIAPIRTGDFVYSAAWSPNEPMRFALIGKIDVNRDGRDDREDLKRMIKAAGGIVDYDLPPPDAGKETGKLTARDAWYVIDERGPVRPVYGTRGVTAGENTAFLKLQSEAIRAARADGVRPMPLERLLPYLGYDYQAPVVGRAEAVDTQSLRRLVAPRQDPNKPKPVAPDETKAEEPAEKDAAK